MSEQPKDIDQLFREKLSGQSINPCPMAWGKLEERLSQKKRAAILWMGIAASLLFLLGVTALLWINLRTEVQAIETLTDRNSLPEIIQKQAPVLRNSEEIQMSHEEKKEEVPLIKKNQAKKARPKKTTQNVVITKPKPSIKKAIPLQETAPLALPPLDMDQLMAENENPIPEVEPEEEVVYKLTIISNGIKASPEKETLVGEIENKIDKIGGLFVKMDQGFADLQDAKNSLFASITSKK